jgi:hypothetical protein
MFQGKGIKNGKFAMYRGELHVVSDINHEKGIELHKIDPTTGNTLCRVVNKESGDVFLEYNPPADKDHLVITYVVYTNDVTELELLEPGDSRVPVRG